MENLGEKESMTVNNPAGQSKPTGPMETVKHTVGVVKAAFLNYRTAPRVTPTNVAGNLKEDTKITIVGHLNDVWSKILVDGEERFVMSEYIEEA